MHDLREDPCKRYDVFGGNILTLIPMIHDKFKCKLLSLTTLSFLITSTLTIAQSSNPSSVLPTLVAPTPTSVGNASDIKTYPLCAQICSNETAPFLPVAIPGCNDASLDCVCSAYFRSTTAACQEVTCSQADIQTTQKLAQQLCGPLYSNNGALSTSVASAVASATASASAAVAGKDPRNLASYPSCAVSISEIYFWMTLGPVSND
ncbi:MAG: hypothetical protein Q9200_004217 [Gallowayella weberi]